MLSDCIPENIVNPRICLQIKLDITLWSGLEEMVCASAPGSGGRAHRPFSSPGGRGACCPCRFPASLTQVTGGIRKSSD